MTLDEKRQHELEHDERWLAAMLGPSDAERTRRVAREAVRLAMNERWLDDEPTHVPRPRAIAQVRAAIRQELAAGRRAAHHRLFGLLSAAAAIVLAFGVSWNASRMSGVTARSATLLAAVPAGDNFIEAWEAVQSKHELAALEEGVAWLGEEISSLARTQVHRRDELEIDSLQDRIDWLLSEPTDIFGTS